MHEELNFSEKDMYEKVACINQKNAHKYFNLSRLTKFFRERALYRNFLILFSIPLFNFPCFEKDIDWNKFCTSPLAPKKLIVKKSRKRNHERVNLVDNSKTDVNTAAVKEYVPRYQFDTLNWARND